MKTKVIDKEEIDVGNYSVADDLINTTNKLLKRHGFQIEVKFYENEPVKSGEFPEEGGKVKLLKVI